MSYLNFEIKHSSNNYNRTGLLHTWNGREIKTPVAWFGLSIVESPELMKTAFKSAKIQAYISNIFDLIYQDKKNKRHEMIQNFSQIEFGKNGLYHKCDSGGFQMMKELMKRVEKVKNSSEKSNSFNLIEILKQNKNPVKALSELDKNNRSRSLKYLTQELVYNAQAEIKPDISVILDLPLNPFLNRDEQKACVDWTIKNYEIARKLNKTNKISLLPVIHGYDSSMLDYAIEKLEEVNQEPIQAVGIGSLVPMAKSLTGSAGTGSKWNLLNLLLELREKLPKTMIHAFGLGGTMSYLAILCGVDSIDSTGWIQKTAYGTIQLPGISDRFLEKKDHGRPYLISNRKIRGEIINEIDIFMKCKCEACKPYYIKNWHEKDWKKKKDAFRQYSEESRLKRIIHNLSLFQSEILLMQKAISEDNLTVFVKKRLKRSIYSKKVDAIIKWQNGDKSIIKNNIKKEIKSIPLDKYLKIKN